MVHPSSVRRRPAGWRGLGGLSLVEARRATRDPVCLGVPQVSPSLVGDIPGDVGCKRP